MKVSLITSGIPGVLTRVAAPLIRRGNMSMSLSTDEVVSVVDENNVVLKNTTRSSVRNENLRHQATFILVEDDRQRLVVQKRTHLKDYCPGYFDVTTGGVLTAGEDYLPSAHRELTEEIGISNACLEPMFKFLYEDDTTRCWGGAFLCRFNGDISSLTLQPEEVESVSWMTADDIHARIANGECFTPDSMYCYDLVNRLRSGASLPPGVKVVDINSDIFNH